MRTVRIAVGALASLAILLAVVLMATLGSDSDDRAREPVKPVPLEATTVVLSAPAAQP